MSIKPGILRDFRSYVTKAAFTASSLGPECLKFESPEIVLVTSSGRFNMTLDSSMYFRAMGSYPVEPGP